MAGSRIIRQIGFITLSETGNVAHCQVDSSVITVLEWLGWGCSWVWSEVFISIAGVLTNPIALAVSGTLSCFLILLGKSN